MSQITTRPARTEDLAQWRRLYRGYADFDSVKQSEEDTELVWSWINDPEHEVNALVALDVDGRLIGLAHYRPFARPLSASIGCFLDDLYVAPEVRGTGASDQLLRHLQDLAERNCWTVVRWITADDNYRARSKYDHVATKTNWVTYDMAPSAPCKQA